MPGRARRSRPNASIEELDDSEDEQQEQAAQRGGAASRRRSNRGMPELTFGFHFLTWIVSPNWKFLCNYYCTTARIDDDDEDEDYDPRAKELEEEPLEEDDPEDDDAELTRVKSEKKRRSGGPSQRAPKRTRQPNEALPLVNYDLDPSRPVIVTEAAIQATENKVRNFINISISLIDFLLVLSIFIHTGLY